MKFRKLLSITIFCSVSAALWAVWQQHPIFDLLKPLTTTLIIAFTLVAKAPPTYRRRIVAGLVFCLIGDIFLLRERFFLFGLGSFLVAHACFIRAMWGHFGVPRSVPVLLGLLAFGAGYYYLLWPGLAALALPVAIYTSVILLMGAVAFGNAVGAPSRATRLLAVAALLFTISDALIGYHKFVAAVPAAQVLILGTYWAAVYLFGRSVYVLQPGRRGSPNQT